MELKPYVDGLGRALASAGTAGGAEAEQILERFAAPLESAIRLAMLNVLSAAADEITSGLAPGSVDVRLRGGEPQFVVTPPPPPDRPVPSGEQADPAPPPVADEAATARISLRLSDRLKAGVDEAASNEGLSVNTWLVRVVAAALDAEGRRRATGLGLQIGQSYTGWAR